MALTSTPAFTVLVLFSGVCFAGNETAPNRRMLPGDSRIVVGKEGSPFEYKTVLPGYYNRVESGMYRLKIIDGNCSTRLFECHIEEYLPYYSVATIKGTIKQGLNRVTFLSDVNVPIVVLFYIDFLRPDLDQTTLQWPLMAPLVIGGKGKESVKITYYLTKMKMLGALRFTINVTENNVPMTDESLQINMEAFPQVLNIENRTFFLHEVIDLVVKRRDVEDIYTLRYGDKYITHTILWDVSEDDLPKYSPLDDLISLLPMEKMIRDLIQN